MSELKPEPKEYRKTATIWAVQLTQEMMNAHVLDGEKLPDGVICVSSSHHPQRRTIDRAHFVIRTLEGSLSVSPDDWIATGVKGEHWAIKPDVFVASYVEAVAHHPKPSQEAVDGDRIAEIIADGDGIWQSCSGCYETNDGYDVGERDPAFGCHRGCGCRECGGLGAVWDTTDYADMAEFILREEAEDEARQEAVKRVQEMINTIDAAPHEPCSFSIFKDRAVQHAADLRALLASFSRDRR